MSQGMLGTLPLSAVRGPRNDLEEKLAGPNGAYWLAAFSRFLRREDPWAETAAQVVASPASRPWKTITLGTTKGYKVMRWAADILPKIPCVRQSRKLELDLVLDTDFGLTAEYSYVELRSAAKARGYPMCPAQVGPDLREQYADQPVGEKVHVLMHPIKDSDMNLRVFSVARDADGAYLSTRYVNPERKFVLGTLWVVCRPAASV